MGKFLLKRLLQYVLVLLVVSVIIFVMVRLSGVDPVAVILGGKQTSQETIQNVRTKFGLDKPQIEQFFSWIKNIVFHGDFGLSYKYQQPVADQMAGRISVTLGLVFFSSIMALIVAIPFGIICALKKNTPLDTGVSTLGLVLVSCPPFLTSMIMVLLITKFAPQIRFTGGIANFQEYMQRLFLPSVALAFSMIALVSRVMRASMIEQLQSSYVEAATAKGLRRDKIITAHTLKNAIIPVISVFSIQFGALIVGSVMVENVFSLAGMGSLLVESIKSSDYPIVQAVTLLLVFAFLTISLLVDILYALIDPRIRID